MELSDFLDCPVIDGHIHYPHPGMMGDLMGVCDKHKLHQFNIVCTPHPSRLSLVPDALHLKAHYPERAFVFGGLDVSVYFREPARVGALFAAYVDMLRGLGCDGIKMLEAKPEYRKMLRVPPFNSAEFAPYWEKLAESQFPLLMHVNDPEEFWDAAKAPKWAFERGWFYGDGTYVNNEAQYAEVLDVLKNNPQLKVIFAHFFFMSAQLPRLAEILERYPNVCVDLTPGIEMYTNFCGNLEKTRDFFLKFQDRILFGTDIGAKALLVTPEKGIELDESYGRIFLVRNFLENPGEFCLQSDGGVLFGDAEIRLRGLGLPPQVLQKIYRKNFEKIASPEPRKIDPGAIVEFCDQVERMIELQGLSQPGIPGDKFVVNAVRSYFLTLC